MHPNDPDPSAPKLLSRGARAHLEPPGGVVIPLRSPRSRTAAARRVQRARSPSQLAAKPQPSRPAQLTAVLVAVELALLGVVGLAMWWATLGWTTGQREWFALAAAGWVASLHLPLVVVAVWLRRRNH